MDYLDQLRNQKVFLRNSMHMFHSIEIEAIRIATTIRVLVHDTGSSTSLLTHLGVKSNTQYLDTAYPEDAFAGFNLSGVNVEVNFTSFLKNSPYAGLVSKNIEKINSEIQMTYKPIATDPELSADKYPTKVFDDWWKGKIYDNKNGKRLLRKDLILFASNKDGGAHVDTGLPANYNAIKNENHIEIQVNGLQRSFDNVPLYSSIYQVGWELLRSLGP